MKKIFALLLCAVMIAGMFAGCGAPEHNPITDKEQIFQILVNHDFGYYVENGIETWTYDISDEKSLEYTQQILDMFKELGYDYPDETAESLSQAITAYYEIDSRLNIFETACVVLEADSQTYMTIYEAKVDLLEAKAFSSYTGIWNNSEIQASLDFDGKGEITLYTTEKTTQGSYWIDQGYVCISLDGEHYYGGTDAFGKLTFENIDGSFERGAAVEYVPEVEETVSIVGYWDNETEGYTLHFLEDSTVRAASKYGISEGVYIYDGELLLVRLFDIIYSGTPTADGTMALTEWDGVFTKVEQPAYGDGVTDLIPSGYITEPDRDYDYMDETMAYKDFDSELYIEFPYDMECQEDYLGEGTAAVMNAEGTYVILDNVTAQYSNFTGSDEEFINTYLNGFLTSLMERMYYTSWNYNDFYIVYDGKDNTVAKATLYLTQLFWDEYPVDDLYVSCRISTVYHENGEAVQLAKIIMTSNGSAHAANINNYVTIGTVRRTDG